MLEHAHLAHLGQGRRRIATKSGGQVGHDIADRIAHAGFDAGDEHPAFPGCREFEDDRLVPARLLEAAEGGLGCDGEAHALCSSRMMVSDASGSDARRSSEGGARIETGDRRGESVDVELARHLGDADEQSLLADGHSGLDALGAERVDDSGAR